MCSYPVPCFICDYLCWSRCRLRIQLSSNLMMVSSIRCGVYESGKYLLILSIGNDRFQFSGFLCSNIMPSMVSSFNLPSCDSFFMRCAWDREGVACSLSIVSIAYHQYPWNILIITCWSIHHLLHTANLAELLLKNNHEMVSIENHLVITYVILLHLLKTVV